MKQRIGILFVFLCLVGVLVYSLAHTGRVKAEWFNDAWGYRQAIRFTNGGSAVSDQKILVQVATSTAIAANKMQSSCQDVRFTDASGRLLQYYINVTGGAGVGCNDASSDFYVLLPSIIAGENTIYIYFGNPTAPAGTVSSNFGNATFSPSAGPTASSEEVTPGAIAYWKFDENSGAYAYDSSGHSNTLTLTNTAWATQSASLSNRTTFVNMNGATSVASRANDTDFDFGTGSFSVSAWFRHAATASFTDVLITKYNTTGWKIYMNSSGFICFGIDDDSSWGPDDSACSTVSFADSKWHHVEAVKSTTTSITLYIDGNQVAQTLSLTATGTLSTTATLYVGADSSGTTSWWDGAIDDIALYPYARSNAQVAIDTGGSHNATVMGAQTKDPLTDGLVGYWKMDESGNSDRFDSSGNGNTLSESVGDDIDAVTGTFGKGADFENSTAEQESVSISDALHKGLDITGALTVCAWVNPETVAYSSIIGKFSSPNLSYDLHLQANGSIIFYVSSDGTTYAQSNSNSSQITTNSWSHVCGVYTGRTIQTFVQGSPNGASTAYDLGIFSGSADVVVGGAWGDYFDGIIDEVRVYNRALSDGEIRQLSSWAPGPVGHWSMDENTGESSTSDLSGNGATMTLNGSIAPSAWVPGKYGSALKLDGVNDFLSTPDTGVFESDNFSLEAWVNFDSLPSATGESCTLLVKSHAVSPYYSYLWTIDTSGRSQIAWTNTVPTEYYSGSNAAITAPHRWYHLVLVKSGGSIRHYIDGSNQTNYSDTLVGSSYNSTGPLWIGAQSNGTTARCKGSVDDVKLYNYARSPSQIIMDVSARGGSAIGGNGGPVFNWKLDESQGATANNTGYGGSAYNGSISGATWYQGGKIGSAISTATSTNFVSAGDVSALDSASGFTTGFWVKPIALATNKALISKSNMSNQNAFAVVTDATNSDEIRVHVPTSVSDTGTYFTTSNLNLSADVWSYVNVIYNASELASSRVRVYKDGKEISGSVTGTLPSSVTTGTTSLLKIGASDSGSFTALNAIFDEVKLYPYALSYDQLLIDMNGKNALQLGSLSTDADGITASNSATRESCVPGDSSACAAPIGWWKFDENTGANANDTSGNGYSGAISGATWVTGKMGGAVNFAGGSDAVTVTGSLSTKTVEFWINPTTTTQNIMDLRTAATAASISVSSGTIAATGFTSPSIYVNGISTSTLTANTWQFVTITTSTAITANAIRFGRISSTSLSGKLDGIMFFDYVRTPAQIAWDYNHGAPVAWYTFDECQGAVSYNSAPSASGQAAGNNGTITIGATGSYTSAGTCGSAVSTESWYAGTTGKFGAALALDGTNDYVTLGTPAALNTPYTSIAAWVNITNPTDGNSREIYSRPNSSNNGTVGLRKDATNNFFQFQVRLDGTESTTRLATGITTASTGWHHIVGTYDGSTMKLYVDGKEDASTTIAGTIDIDSLGSIAVGRHPTSINYFSGLLDDVRIYSYALTPAQVRIVMNQGSAVRFGP